MDNSTLLTYLVIASLVAFGLYRKNHSDRPVPQNAQPVNVLSEQSYRVGKEDVARLVFEVQKKLPDSETITQVYDYSNEPRGSGIVHSFDVATFNMATTQALTKRITCIQRGSDVELLSSELVSPVTGKTQSTAGILDEVIDAVVDGPSDGDEGSRFVRDKYSFIQQHQALPPEPRLSDACAGGLVSERCESERGEYHANMLEYQKYINEVRNNSPTVVKRDIKFLPTSKDSIENGNPFEKPQSFGHAEHTEIPLDVSALSLIQPLKDEQFLDVVSAQKSALAIQYG